MYRKKLWIKNSIITFPGPKKFFPRDLIFTRLETDFLPKIENHIAPKSIIVHSTDVHLVQCGMSKVRKNWKIDRRTRKRSRRVGHPWVSYGPTRLHLPHRVNCTIMVIGGVEQWWKTASPLIPATMMGRKREKIEKRCRQDGTQVMEISNLFTTRTCQCRSSNAQDCPTNRRIRAELNFKR